MIFRLFIAMYILAGAMAYGHFWNNSSPTFEEEQKISIALIIPFVHPLYWSVVLFEVDDD